MAPFQPLTVSPVAPDSPTDEDDDDDEVDDGSKGRGRRGSSSSGYEFVSNAAKRAFLMENEGVDDDFNKGLPERPSSACTNQSLNHEAIAPRPSDVARKMEVVRRGLSMTNIHSPSPTFSCVTRTTSHVSLSSASSSSSSEARRPVRTVSQVTLTLKKLSPLSDSASSSSKDEVNDPTPDHHQLQQQQLQLQQQQQKSRRVRSLPKTSANIARYVKKGHLIKQLIVAWSFYYVYKNC